MEPSFVTILPGIRLSTLENMESGEKIIKIGPLVQKIGNFLVESIVKFFQRIIKIFFKLVSNHQRDLLDSLICAKKFPNMPKIFGLTLNDNICSEIR